MKKITKTLVLATAAVALAFGVKPAQAQVSTTSGNTIVTVTVVDVLLLAVAIPAVPLKLATTDDYTKGTSFVAPAQLTASSNHTYDIKVQALTDLQGQLTAAGTTIPISNVSVQTTPTLSPTNYSDPLPLSTGNLTLIQDAPPAMLKSYDVKYSIGGNNSNFLNIKSGAYTSTVTYSIFAK